MDLSPWCHPAASPSPGNLLAPGALSFSSRLQAQSREGLHGAEQLPFFPEQMTLGQAEQLGRNSNSPAGSLGLPAPLPPSSQGVNLHLGPFQIQRDSWGTLAGDPGP